MSNLLLDTSRPVDQIYVSGVGIVTALGNDAAANWKAILQGKSACRALSSTDIDHFDSLSQLLNSQPVGATVSHQQIADLAVARAAQLGYACHESLVADPLNAMVLAAVLEAVQDSKFCYSELTNERVGCVIGTSKPSLRALERAVQNKFQETTDHLWSCGFLPESPLNTVRSVVGAKGPTDCPVAACATGVISVLRAVNLIRSGLCDVCIVASGDASLRASVLAGFHRLGVTTRSAACRPFDHHRDGFFVGEGAAALILESHRSRKARNAECYGTIGKCGWATDPTGMTQIDESGQVVSDLLNGFLDKLPAAISVHGTATRSNDFAEGRGLLAVFESALDHIPVFGTKGATGHLLGGAGSVELALAMLAVRDKIVPASYGFCTPDPKVGLNLTKSTEQISAGSLLKLSLGFGGHVAACEVSAE